MTNNLQTFLDANSLTISQLARRVNMAVPPVWRMVNGQQEISDGFRWRFSQAFGNDVALSVLGNGNGHDHAVTSIAPQGGFVDTP